MKKSQIPVALREIVKDLLAIAPSKQKPDYQKYCDDVYKTVKDYKRLKSDICEPSSADNFVHFFVQALKILVKDDIELNKFHKDFMAIFKKYVKDPNQISFHQQTFLESLVKLSKSMRPSVFEAFAKNAIELGADINLLNELETPLTTSLKLRIREFSTETGPYSTDITRILLSLGADPDQENGLGELPLNLAILQKYFSELDVSPHLALLSYGASTDLVETKSKLNPLARSCKLPTVPDYTDENRVYEVVKDLLEHGADPANSRSSWHENRVSRVTNLMFCAFSNFTRVAELLLNAGAYEVIDLTPKSNEIVTTNPLGVAIIQRHDKMTSLLLNHGASSNIELDEPRRPSPLATALNEGTPEAVKMLMLHGAEEKVRWNSNMVTIPKFLTLPGIARLHEHIAKIREVLSFRMRPFDKEDSGDYINKALMRGQNDLALELWRAGLKIDEDRGTPIPDELVTIFDSRGCDDHEVRHLNYRKTDVEIDAAKAIIKTAKKTIAEQRADTEKSLNSAKASNAKQVRLNQQEVRITLLKMMAVHPLTTEEQRTKINASVTKLLKSLKAGLTELSSATARTRDEDGAGAGLGFYTGAASDGGGPAGPGASADPEYEEGEAMPRAEVTDVDATIVEEGPGLPRITEVLGARAISLSTARRKKEKRKR